MKINVTAELNAVPLEACDDFFCVIIRCNKCVAVKGYYLEENVHYSMSVCSRRQVLCALQYVCVFSETSPRIYHLA